LASHLPRKDVGVVPHGSDIDLLSIADKQECWLAGSDRLEVLTIGAVFHYKRLDRAIEIVSCLARLGVVARLSMWGGTPERALLNGLRATALEALGYDPFRGPLPHEQRAEVLRRSDVLIFPSARESFGFPLIEALRTSTVVVGPTSPLVDELCRGAAITFDEGNPQTAAAELVAALPRLSAIADAGRAVGERYTWEACVEQTLFEILGAAKAVSGHRG
jgi:glycosyltransferase involved in cell wall biosynthesis